MKLKYIAATIAVGTVLLTSNNTDKPSRLEKSLQTTSISQTSDSNNLPIYPQQPSDPKDVDLNAYMKTIQKPQDKSERKFPAPYSQPTPKDPFEYDPPTDMKAILPPRDRIYEDKKGKGKIIK